MYESRARVSIHVHPIRRFPASIVVVVLLLVTAVVHAETMPFSQVKKGMKGYGVTVFEGTTPEKFDVEILGVLNNIGPSQNLILAKIDGPVIRRTGVIAGMLSVFSTSGTPGLACFHT